MKNNFFTHFKVSLEITFGKRVKIKNTNRANKPK